MFNLSRLGFPGTLLFSTLLLTSCQTFEPAQTAKSPREIETIADEYLAAMLERYPEVATSYSIEGARHDRLFDNSLDALAEWQKREDEWLAELGGIGEPAVIGSRDWVTYGFLFEELAAAQASRICHKELWETSTTTAWHVELPFLFDIQPLETEDLKNQSLARLSEVDGFIDTEIGNLRMGLQLGYSSPRITVEKVPEEVRALLKENNPFLGMGKRAKNDAFDQAVEKIFVEEITPAIKRFASFIENEYLKQARTEIALSYNPNGADCYPTLVRSFATIDLSADEIHKMGLTQIAKIRAEMLQILAEHYNNEKIETFIRRVNVDKEFTFRSEEAVLSYSVESLAIAREKMTAIFGHLPKADVIIKPYPAFAASGVGEYHSSSEDSTRPGIYYIAVQKPESRTQATQQSTLYHETYPGHHLQGAIALELGDRVHPIARYIWNSGFGEGWALYSERVAQELDLYNGPLDLMGLLSDQAARAARLVIDSGIHTKGWTRQQSVDYMMNNTAWAAIDIQNDINRYISWPGQANSYMLGMLEIRRLRNLAEEQLGEQFNIKQFHSRILENGSLPLPMVEKSVLAWIDETKSQ